MINYTLAEIEAALLPGSQSGTGTTPFAGTPPAASGFSRSRLNAAAQAGLSDHWFDRLPEQQKNACLASILTDSEVVQLADAGRSEWFKLLMAIADAGHRGATEFRDRAQAWCRTSPRYSGEADVDRDLASHNPGKPGGITFGTLISAAESRGIDLSPWRTLSSTTVAPGATAATIGVLQGSAFAAAVTPSPFFTPVPSGAASLHCTNWISPGFLMVGETTLLVSQGGGAKTATAIHAGAAMAAGRTNVGPFQVNNRPDGLRIAIISGEEDSNRIGMLSAAAGLALNFTAAEYSLAAKNLLIHDAQASGWRLGEPEPGTRATIAPEAQDRSAQALRAALIQSRPDVLIIDTASATFALPSELDNNAITSLMRRASRLARDVGCAVLLIHHTPKMTRETAATLRGDPMSVRGGSAWTNSARVVLTLAPASAAESGQFAMRGISPDQVRRLEHAKINDRKPMDPVWLEIKSVQVTVHDGSAHAVRAVDFLPAMLAAGGVPDAVRNLTMKTIDAGTVDGHGAKVPYSPGGGAKNKRDATQAVADAIVNSMGMTEVHARSAARDAIKDLKGIGCVMEQDVQVPQYKSNGQPNGTQSRRGLVCHWNLAPWLAGQSTTATAAPATGATPGAIVPAAPSPGGGGVP